MEKFRLHQLPKSFKCAITAFLLLVSLGFGVAALMSLDHYGLSHAKTVIYYRGDEQAMAFPKLYPQLLQTLHVHSFTMPLVFFAIWIGLQFTDLSQRTRIFWIVGGAVSILAYNTAPFLLRYVSVHAAWLFTVGGVGLFVFYFIPVFFLLYEVWKGSSACKESI